MSNTFINLIELNVRFFDEIFNLFFSLKWLVRYIRKIKTEILFEFNVEDLANLTKNKHQYQMRILLMSIHFIMNFQFEKKMQWLKSNKVVNIIWVYGLCVGLFPIKKWWSRSSNHFARAGIQQYLSLVSDFIYNVSDFIYFSESFVHFKYLSNWDSTISFVWD